MYIIRFYPDKDGIEQTSEEDLEKRISYKIFIYFRRRLFKLVKLQNAQLSSEKYLDKHLALMKKNSFVYFRSKEYSATIMAIKED